MIRTGANAAKVAIKAAQLELLSIGAINRRTVAHLVHEEEVLQAVQPGQQPALRAWPAHQAQQRTSSSRQGLLDARQEGRAAAVDCSGCVAQLFQGGLSTWWHRLPTLANDVQVLAWRRRGAARCRVQVSSGTFLDRT